MLVKNNSLTLLICAVLLFTSSHFAAATNLYISDELYVPVRKGQGNQFSILHKGLPSGTRVTLIERDTEWTKIKTAGGVTGWVRNQFLNSTPPAKLQLEYANKKIATLTEELEKLKQEKTVLSENYRETKNELSVTEAAAQKTEKEFNDLKAISSSAIQSREKLREQTEKIEILQTENDVLKSENESLRRSESTTFFIYGAFAVLLGVLLAIILPKLKPNKRNTGWIN